MKHQPYFNNPRIRLNEYQGPPRNRAERRAMAKATKPKGRRVEKSTQLSRIKQKTNTLKPHTFVPTTYKFKEKLFYDELTDDELLEAEAAQYKELKKAQTNLKREITRRENVDIKEYLKEDEYDNANSVNEALAYASSVYGGNNEYTQYLKSLMKNLVNDMSYKPKAGDDNEYFKVSEDYTGKDAELFKYVEFKKIPDEYSQDVEAIQDLDWSSSENYYSHLADIAHQQYKSNLGGKDVEPQVVDRLEQIMNTSAAWHIASKWTDDSEQVQAYWQALFDAGSMALNTSSAIFDSFCQMVRNEEDISTILETVDDLVYKALKE